MFQSDLAARSLESQNGNQTPFNPKAYQEYQAASLQIKCSSWGTPGDLEQTTPSPCIVDTGREPTNRSSNSGYPNAKTATALCTVYRPLQRKIPPLLVKDQGGQTARRAVKNLEASTPRLSSPEDIRNLLDLDRHLSITDASRVLLVYSATRPETGQGEGQHPETASTTGQTGYLVKDQTPNQPTDRTRDCSA
ncbi:hypothetical protein RRG08_008238 [Elysia crispata]|uniref:Uncharacterized protein n=1 Tax=Elysia crispata TaxID=231223 RepID=A0AAE0YC52_9GAST|nr:hypothetical protein RRG08_008238 [Elysia crispata]